MKNKKFTLTELIIAIIVISILASIVMVKILDMKNKSISAAVSNNTKIIQTAVDRYALDHDGEYPIKNDLTINLQNPQLINIELLKEEKYLKKDLDTSKVKNQYYWLDVFGVAWGSTEKTVNDITLVSLKDKNSRLEFITPAGVVAYRVYEVTGYNKSGTVTNPKDRHYKLVSEVELNKKRQKVNFEIPDKTKTYLISAVDKYEQETAPVGVFYKGPVGFKPILSGEGTYEFEIESFDEMFWVDFRAIEDKPGSSTIQYRFTVKNEQGVYMDWTDDYFSLLSSTGIKVEVTMKGDADGNKPSLYDLNVMYRYAYEEILTPPISEPTDPEKPSKICPAGYTTSTLVNSEWTQGQPKLYSYLVKLKDGQSIERVKTPSFYGYSILNIQYEYADEDGIYVTTSGTFDIPAGSCVNIIFELEEIEKFGGGVSQPGSGGTPGGDSPGPPGSWNPYPPDVVICKIKCIPTCVDCIPKCLENCASYCDTHDCTEEKCKETECIEPPVCEVGDIGCVPPVCTNNCSVGPPKVPNPRDPELTDPDWVTLDELRFFAHGPMETPTRWIGKESVEVEDLGKTRVVYRYASSNGLYWSNEMDEINKVGQSRSLMVIAYLQIHKDVKNNPSQEKPVVKSIKILHERGSFDLSLVQPTLTILPKKNNNEGRDVFSSESVFDWQYVAVDPKGRKITAIEWAGDKFEKYSVGSYTIKARVKNETELWSEWVEYKFNVLEEKPTAIITSSREQIMKGESVKWSFASSYDPDGDKITDHEWSGDYKSTYEEIGNYTVQLRVKDSEGYWSEWVSKSIKVNPTAYLVRRVEGETYPLSECIRYPCKYLDLAETSRGKALQLYNAYYPSNYRITFTGVGFDLRYFNDGNRFPVKIDGQNVFIERDNSKIWSTQEIRNLEHKQHTIEIYDYEAIIDYIDIWSVETKPNISNMNSKVIDENGNMASQLSNVFNPNNQSMNVFFELDKHSTVTVKVKDKENKDVKTLMSKTKLVGDLNFGTHSLVWDGRDTVGNILETGEYTIEVYALGEDKVESSTNVYKVLLANEKPIYRFEGEMFSTSNCTYYPCKHISMEGASKGKVLQLYNAYYPSSFFYSFVGEGFDLRYYNDGNSIPIDVDGKRVTTIVTNKSNTWSTYSLRGLTEASHTLKIYSSTSFIDYIDVFSQNKKPELTNLNSKTDLNATYNTNILLAGVNPLYLFYTISKNSNTSINVKNSSGKTIRTLTASRYDSADTGYNTHNIIWDGKDSSGKYVETGAYTFEIKAIGVGDTGSVIKEHTVQISNETPTKRIEGESLVGTCWNSLCRSVAIVDASGGLALDSYKGYYSPRFSTTFTGTGFDIRYYNDGSTIPIVVDGVKLVTINTIKTYTWSTYSLRDLANKSHTLQVPDQIFIFDYIDIYNN